MGRTDEEIRQACEDWMTGDRLCEVKGYDGARLEAPEVPATQLKALGRER
ncbi:pirin [Streptomyces sp. NPDC052494]